MEKQDPSGRSISDIKEHSIHDKIVYILKKDYKEIIFCGDRKIERIDYNKIANDILMLVK